MKKKKLLKIKIYLIMFKKEKITYKLIRVRDAKRMYFFKLHLLISKCITNSHWIVILIIILFQ